MAKRKPFIVPLLAKVDGHSELLQFSNVNDVILRGIECVMPVMPHGVHIHLINNELLCITWNDVVGVVRLYTEQ